MGAIGLTALLACQKTEDTGSDGDDDSDVSIEVTWGDAQTVASGGTDVITLTFNNTPVGMRDGDNRLHLVWLDGTDLVYGRLESSGWVTGPLERLGSSGLAKPTLASGGGGLVVAWLERLDGNMHVVGTYSADDGATWSTPLQLSTAAHNAVNPSLYAWANENGGTSAVVSWGDEETGQIVGATWTGPSWAASDWTLGYDISRSDADARDVGVRGWGKTLYASWEEGGEENPRPSLYGAKSTDGGVTWGDPKALNATDQNFGGDPSVAFAGEQELYVAYQDQGDVFLCRSTDGGETFGDTITLGDGLFAHVEATANGVVSTAWEHFVGNMKDNSIKTVGLYLSLDGGETGEAPHAMPGSDDVFYTKLGSVAANESVIDVFYILDDGETSSLVHRSGEITD